MVPIMQMVKLGRGRTTGFQDKREMRQEMWEGTYYCGSKTGRMGPLLEERTFTMQAG